MNFKIIYYFLTFLFTFELCLSKNFEKSSLFECPAGFSGELCNLECGLRYHEPNLDSTKIVGGVEAVKGSWPSIAFIKFDFKFRFKLPNSNQTAQVSQSARCGGTLIDVTTVLTAAHCLPKEITFTFQTQQYTVPVSANEFYPTIESMYTIYLGLHDLDNLDSFTIKATVSKLIIHNEYTKNNKFHDIALLKLTNKVELNEFIQISCLPNIVDQQQDPNFPSEYNIDGYVAGWGKLKNDDQTYPSVLHNVKITIYNIGFCFLFPKTNGTTQLCAGVEEESEKENDTCLGDSGGPLFVKVNNGQKYVVAGIVSYGYADCGVIPGIYTKVSYYLDWIKKNIDNQNENSETVNPCKKKRRNIKRNN